MQNKNLFFEYVVLTTKSYEFVSHVVAGKQMRFTKAQIGDGEVIDPDNLANLDELINYKSDADIVGVRGDGKQAIIDININTDHVTDAFKFREVGIFAEIDGEEILYAYLNAGDKFDYLTPNEGGQTFSQTIQFVVAVGNAANVEIVFSKVDIPDASIRLSMLSDEIMDYINGIQSDISEHITNDILGANGEHGLKFDETQAKLKYNKNGAWIDIPTGQAAESEINNHKLLSILNDSGVHDFRYVVDRKKLQYKTGTGWADMEIEGTGDISVTGLTADTLRAGVTVVITRDDQEIDRIVGSYTDDATATSDDIMPGKTAYANGQKITGSMIANTGDIQLSNPSIINSRLQSPTIPDGLYKNATVSFGHNLYPESIKAGIDIYGVRGTYTNDANAVASDILSGKTAYARGSKITGNISTYSGDRSISAPTISGNNLITPTISNGYYNNARLSFPKGNLSPENIKKGVNIFGVTGSMDSGRVLGALWANFWNSGGGKNTVVWDSTYLTKRSDLTLSLAQSANIVFKKSIYTTENSMFSFNYNDGYYNASQQFTMTINTSSTGQIKVCIVILLA
ncbi:Phage protein [Candidatus Arthromitus sp. SFB-mouse-NL]|uniref:phage tail-collar fiber domain-containing protein n=1 Tax=Candidatus Arthromitus sp. SFB-mouse-NL TaxID=1508644 RepID=UPI00049AF6B8|nr:phage tail protein [Candidatus Arthromitus sp. SFB-mouse-NL]AID44085.1 Phage protein [Candidatus Arthromitus sp. SFB-mouse-NL]AID45419.1 Phage protein [Candidatus Arthromitus sp. SFB-mouse-NL]